MGTAKTRVPQTSTKASTGRTTDKINPAPELHSGPAPVQRAASVLPPPKRLTPPAARAGGIVSALEESLKAPPRAQMSAAIQRQVGNTRMVTMLGDVQAKIAVGEPGDRYEREADEVASRVVSGQKLGRISRIAAGGPFFSGKSPGTGGRRAADAFCAATA
jgi:hypothetical protein